MKNNFIKAIAISLALVTISLPTSKAVYALETTLENTFEIKKDALDLLKNVYTNKSLKKVSKNVFSYKKDNYELRINPITGDFNHIFYDENGNVSDKYTTNYIENINNITDEYSEVESRGATIYKQHVTGPSKLYVKVEKESSSKVKLSIRDHYGNKKSYTKSTSNYYSGRTKEFIDRVWYADYHIDKAIKLGGATLIAAILAGVGTYATGGTITNIIVAVCTSLGISFAHDTIDKLSYRIDKYNYHVRKAQKAYHG